MNLSAINTRIQTEIQKIAPELITIRRHLHQHPEVGREEFQTTDYLLRQLSPLNLELFTKRLPTGLWADLNLAPAQPRLALRCDIDALPIQEQNEAEYRSCQPGVMHACGHDVHTTILLGTAMVLSRLRHELPLNVRFLFQPAEELTPGGARDVIRAGGLEGVAAILGAHVDPSLPVGEIGIKFGPVMAATDNFRLKLFGRGGHAAYPHTTIDPIQMAAQIINAIYQLTSRNVRPTTPAVLTVTQINAGTAINIIPESVELSGTIRSLDNETRELLQQRLRQIIGGICQAHAGRFELALENGAPPLWNEPRLTQLVTDAAREIFGAARVRLLDLPEMGSEDFACYLEKIPGMMFRLGTQNPSKKQASLHHPQFDVDEECLAIGVQLFCWSVVRYFDQPNLR